MKTFSSLIRPIMSMLIMATALSERQRRFFHPLGRTEQAEFFSCKRSEENSALELALHRREQARQFHHAGGAGGVVVRARMNLADLRRRERIHVAVAQMIVVRADDDVFVGLPRKVGEHIIHRGACALDVDAERNAQIAGKRERIRR